MSSYVNRDGMKPKVPHTRTRVGSPLQAVPCAKMCEDVRSALRSFTWKIHGHMKSSRGSHTLALAKLPFCACLSQPQRFSSSSRSSRIRPPWSCECPRISSSQGNQWLTIWCSGNHRKSVKSDTLGMTTWPPVPQMHKDEQSWMRALCHVSLACLSPMLAPGVLDKPEFLREPPQQLRWEGKHRSTLSCDCSLSSLSKDRQGPKGLHSHAQACHLSILLCHLLSSCQIICSPVATASFCSCPKPMRVTAWSMTASWRSMVKCWPKMESNLLIWWSSRHSTLSMKTMKKRTSHCFGVKSDVLKASWSQ